MDSNELQTFIQDVRDDLNNLDSLIDYYDFLGHHNIRTIVFNPEDESSFFEGWHLRINMDQIISQCLR